MNIAKEPPAVPKELPSPSRFEQQEALQQEAPAQPGADEMLRAHERWLEQMAMFHRAKPALRSPVPVTTTYVSSFPS